MADNTTTQTTHSSGSDVFWQAVDRFNTLVDETYVAAQSAVTHLRNNDFQLISDTLDDLTPIMGSIYSAQYLMDPSSLKSSLDEIAQDINNNLTKLLGYLQSAMGDFNLKTESWQENKTLIYPTLTKIRTSMGAAGIMTIQAKTKSN